MNKKEKYEMKMAKYNANKARKAEKESRIKELERVKELAKKQNGSTADVEKHIYRYICPTLLDGDIEAKMTKIANDFFEKRMMAVAVPCVYNDKEILLSCVNYGSNTADVGFECVTFGIIDFNDELGKKWNECFQKANIKYMTNLLNDAKYGVAHLHHNYISARSYEEVVDKLRYYYINDRFTDVVYWPELENVA